MVLLILFLLVRGLEQLAVIDTSGDQKRRHFAYYLSLAEEAATNLKSTEQNIWLNRLEHEYKNFEAALWWCADYPQCDAGLRLSGELWRFWMMRGHLHEGRRWLEKFLLSSTSVSLTTRTKALEGASVLACRQKDYKRATTLAEEALVLSKQLENQEILHGAYIVLAEAAYSQGESQRAVVLLEESLNICRMRGDTRGTASPLNNLGNILLQQGKFNQAALRLEESHALFHEVEDKLSIASVMNNMGEVEWHRKNFKLAAPLYEESLTLSRELKYSWGIAASLANLARFHANLDGALVLYQESLTLFNALGDKIGILLCLEGVAEIAYSQRQYEQAWIVAATM